MTENVRRLEDHRRGQAFAFARGDHAEIADRLFDALEGERKHVVGALGRIWSYGAATGVYRQHERDELRKIVKGFAGSPKGEEGTLKVTSGAAEGAITLAHAEVSRSGFFDDSAVGIAFANGFVTVDGGEIKLVQHSPKHRARQAHAFAYEAKAPAAELHELLEQVFEDASEDDRAARIACLQEHVGACLLGIAPRYQKCALLLGRGGNGKSTILNALYRGALPDGTFASLPPQLWSERFQLARLIGMLANVCDEIPESEILKTGVFKAAIDGSRVHVEEKNRDPFDASLRCGHVFCANALPATSDLTDGFFRRFMVVQFSRRFDNTDGCDPMRAERVVAACRPGIVAFALEGAARLQRQGRYTEPASSLDIVTEWKRGADNVAVFLDEQTRAIQANELGTSPKVLYGRYKAWAISNGHGPLSSTKFKSRLEAHGKPQTRGTGGARYYPVVPYEEG